MYTNTLNVCRYIHHMYALNLWMELLDGCGTDLDCSTDARMLTRTIITTNARMNAPRTPEMPMPVYKSVCMHIRTSTHRCYCLIGFQSLKFSSSAAASSSFSCTVSAGFVLSMPDSKNSKDAHVFAGRP